MTETTHKTGFFDRFLAWKQKQTDIDLDNLNQFVVGLKSELDVLLNAMPDRDENDINSVKIITEQLKEVNKQESVERKWSRAYHAEKLLLALYNDERIKVELRRRLDQCKRLNAPFLPFYHDEIEKRNTADEKTAGIDVAANRELLLSLIGDLQTFNSKRHISMRYARLAIHRVGRVFVISLVLFLLVLSFGHWSFSSAEQNEETTVALEE